MDRLAQALVIIGLTLATPQAAGQAVLRQHGVSAALATLAANAPAPSFNGVRGVGGPAPGTPRKFMQAALPAYPLPPPSAMPALPQVQTGGTRINTDGIAPGAGGAGVTGAAGAQQYVQLAAGRMAVYRKHDGALQFGPVGIEALFAGAGPAACTSAQSGTGSVLYERHARRWIVAWLAGAVQCIAVSSSADALGGYYRYALQLQGAGREALQAEDARMALWSDALYFSFVLFDNAHGSYRGPRICAIARAPLLRGRDAALRCVDPGSEFGPAIVATLEGDAQAPRGAPALIVSLDFTDRLLLWRWPLAGAPRALPVAPFRRACGDACIPQPHPGGALSAPGDRLLPRVAWRQDTLLLAHAVQLDDARTGLRWYELRDPLGAAYVYQQGTHAPDRAHRTMGSIGVDKAGNIALGYSVAGADTPPGVRYSGRLRSDPPGRMAGEEVVVGGSGVQPGQARLWPAGGALSLDPDDDCTFWYTQQYLAVTGVDTWRTRIASFKFRNCR